MSSKHMISAQSRLNLENVNFARIIVFTAELRSSHALKIILFIEVRLWNMYCLRLLSLLPISFRD